MVPPMAKWAKSWRLTTRGLRSIALSCALVAGCSDSGATDAGAEQPVQGAAAGRSGTGAPAASAGRASAGAAATPAAPSTPRGGAGAAAPGPTAAGGGANVAPTMPSTNGPAPVRQCGGRDLPPRALGTPGPYAIGPGPAGLPPYFPTDDWRALDPAMLGFDPAKLDDALAYNPASLKTEALLVIRHGYIAAEKYFGSFTQTSRHQSFSMAKSFTSALIGVMIEEGKLSGVDEKLCKYYPQQWKCDDPSDKHGLITVHHALTLTTGLQWQEDWRTNGMGPNDASAGNTVQNALRKPVVDEPGTKVRYSTADPALLRAVVEQNTGMGVLEYARAKLFDTMGLGGLQWNGDTYFGIQATAREYAKFGYLYLNGGQWDGKQLVPQRWVEDSTRSLNDKDPDPDPDVCQDWYYYLWHINLPNRLGSGVEDKSCATQFCTSQQYANLPPEAYFAEGLAGQYIFVVPSADLVLVRLGNDGIAGIEIWDAYTRGLLERVLDAIP